MSGSDGVMRPEAITSQRKGDITGAGREGAHVPYVKRKRITLADLNGRTFARVWEAAQILEADQRTLLTMLAAGEIPGTRVGAQWRVPVAWLREAASGKAPSQGVA
jgi:excisionase family DNA binding protein